MNHLIDGTLLVFVAVACITLGRPLVAAGIGALALVLLTK